MSRSLMLLALSASTAQADVLVVGPPESGLAFHSIQAAVDAAAPGDLILVRAGVYTEPLVIDAPLTLMGEPGVEVELHGTLFVTGIAEGEQLLIAQLEVHAPDELVAAWVTASEGVVRFQDVAIVGGRGRTLSGDASDGADGVRVFDCRALAFTDCGLYGGRGGGDGLTMPFGGHGGHALVTTGSPLALHGCLLAGGDGGPADTFGPTTAGGNGGDACRIESFGAFVAGCTLRGGDGGSGSIYGSGGDCVEVAARAGARILDTVTEPGEVGNFAGGPAEQPGEIVDGDGVVFWIEGAAREIGSGLLALAGTSVEVEVRGEVGDRAWLVVSEVPAHVPATALDGLWFLEHGEWLGSASSTAVLGPEGTATISLKLPELASGVDARSSYVQALVRSASGEPRLSNAIAIVSPSCATASSDCNANGVFDTCELLAQTSGDLDGNGFPDECDPDCNANGAPDAADIEEGTSQDLNLNGIPDECEPHGLVWHIDAGAPGGGDGSVAAPFDELADAFEVALSSDTILVAPGIYAGARNRDLDFFGRDFAVIGSGGASACIIDCEDEGRAFVLENGESAASRIEGFTIRDGYRWHWFGGGAIHAFEASPTIVACVFQGCRSNRGGAISLWRSSSEVRDCLFVENGIPTGGSDGGAIYAYQGNLRFVRCDFVSNFAEFGGAVWMDPVQGGLYELLHCRLLGNHATHTGGGLVMGSAAGAQLVLDHVLFAGNTSANRTGAVWVGAHTRMTSCTLVANQAPNEGTITGYHPTALLELHDVLLWDDLSASAPIRLHGLGARVGVFHSDVEGGPAAIELPPSGGLVWGDGSLDLDPLFVDPDGADDDPLTLLDNDWRLGPGSPCIDAGDDSALAQDGADLDGDGDLVETVPFDLDGLPREVDDPAVPDTGAGRAPLVDIGGFERQG